MTQAPVGGLVELDARAAPAGSVADCRLLAGSKRRATDMAPPAQDRVADSVAATGLFTPAGLAVRGIGSPAGRGAADAVAAEAARAASRRSTGSAVRRSRRKDVGLTRSKARCRGALGHTKDGGVPVDGYRLAEVIPRLAIRGHELLRERPAAARANKHIGLALPRGRADRLVGRRDDRSLAAHRDRSADRGERAVRHPGQQVASAGVRTERQPGRERRCLQLSILPIEVVCQCFS